MPGRSPSAGTRNGMKKTVVGGRPGRETPGRDSHQLTDEAHAKSPTSIGEQSVMQSERIGTQAVCRASSQDMDVAPIASLLAV